MKLSDIIKIIEDFAPVSLQESYDNSGLILGDADLNVNKALICLDVNEEVLIEAIENKCDLIISHHPVIFKGLKKITGRNPVERILIQAIKNNIAIYSAHTNLDNVYHGVNGMLSEKLGLKNTKILSPGKKILRKLVTFCPVDHAEKVREALFSAGAGHIGNYDSCSFNLEGNGSFRGQEDSDPFVGIKGEIHYEKEIRIEMIYPSYIEQKLLDMLFKSHPYEEVAYDIYPLGNEFDRVGAGITGELVKEMDEKKFLDEVKKILNIPCIRHSSFVGNYIKKVALCGGSGSFLIREAIASGAQVFLTGDIKYHDFFEADQKILLADVGHYESEQFTKELLYSILIKKIPNFAILISEVNTNSVFYY